MVAVVVVVVVVLVVVVVVVVFPCRQSDNDYDYDYESWYEGHESEDEPVTESGEETEWVRMPKNKKHRGYH